MANGIDGLRKLFGHVTLSRVPDDLKQVVAVPPVYYGQGCAWVFVKEHGLGDWCVVQVAGRDEEEAVLFARAFALGTVFWAFVRPAEGDEPGTAVILEDGSLEVEGITVLSHQALKDYRKLDAETREPDEGEWPEHHMGVDLGRGSARFPGTQ